ncbi:MAG TPA: ATP-binding protein [Planctomycetota bacterium]|nr:ATP-binding protein [Planctomycetota bacterium]
MDPGLSKNLEETIKEQEAAAEALYQKGDDQGAAVVFDKLAQLYQRWANAAPPGPIEAVRKNKAIACRAKANTLRAGAAPPRVEQTGKPGSEVQSTRPSSDGRPSVSGRATTGEAKDEVSNAVSNLVHQSNVTWEKIGGLEETKRDIKYALGVSLAQKPAGVSLATWRNILFFGPPGTGKTLLAAATSNALRSSAREQPFFFNVKVSSVMSKYFGESTKIISTLYDTARGCSPSVVFLDEFESLCGSREEGDTGTERRILSTILSELDGLAEKGRDDVYVLTIAATNRPWDLDPAVLSRFDKKILIPLPDPQTRRAILEIHLVKKGFNPTCGLDSLVDMTEGLSGREIERFTKEVTNRMISEENKDIPTLLDRGVEELRRFTIKVRALTREDFDRARKHVNPVTSPEEMRRYADWKEQSEV